MNIRPGAIAPAGCILVSTLEDPDKQENDQDQGDQSTADIHRGFTSFTILTAGITPGAAQLG
jgi:hypothetical protein